jgi:hypothetical protein
MRPEISGRHRSCKAIQNAEGGALNDPSVPVFRISPPGTEAAVGLSPLNEVIPGASNGAGNEIGTGITFDTSSLTLVLSLFPWAMAR